MMDNHGYNLIPNSLKVPPDKKIDNWIAFDFEWIVHNSNKSPIYRIEQNTSGGSEAPVFDKKEYSEIVTFGFEDSKGNKGCYDVTDFVSVKSFLQVIKEKLLQYQFCFAWGSKALVRKNSESGKSEGINGDLAILDVNLKANRIPSIISYDKYSSVPFIKKDMHTTRNSILESDIDLLQVFSKPLVRISINKNKYKSLRLDDVCKALLGYGKLDNKTGAKLEEMSTNERKSYCLHDAHLVAELVKVRNGDVLKIMQIIASHTGLKFDEVCQKGMTGIWKKILNDTISRKISLLGYESIPPALRKLYTNKTNYREYENDENYDGNEELLEYKENSYDPYIDLLNQRIRDRNSNTIDDDNVLHSFYLNDKSIRKDNVKPIVKNKYKGGLVLSPLRGLHQDVYLFDITSLYPTMIINYNISPETINCSCCRDNVKARLILDKDIQNHFQHNIGNQNNDHNYWMCKRRKGLFSKILQDLTEKRIQYKNKGMELESTAIKAIINSGYGVFGHPNFKYYEPRVAEVITALGRQTLLEMNKIAKEIGFAVLYGDTDSIFVNNINNIDIPRFIDNCKTRLNVNVNHEKTFRKLILVGKKHYIGILYGDEEQPIIKGMEGIKSDRPEFIQTTFIEMIKDIQNNVSPIPNLRQRFEELDGRQIPKERLSISSVLTKNPIDYTHDDKQKRLGIKLSLKKGDTFTYYKCDKQELAYDSFGKEKTRTVSESDSPADISFAKYKEMLLNSVKDVIEILGYSIEKDLLSKKKWLYLSADN